MGEEAGKSSKAESQPLGTAVALSSRPVFISYASHDAAIAQKVCSALESAGFPCWIAPRNVVPGTMYADGIVHAIDESSILVLILSQHAVASAHVGREIERAVSKRHPVVALRIDAAALTAAFEYFLNQSQWIEGGESDAAIAQLVGAVGQHLAPGTATLPTNAKQASAVHRKAAVGRRVWVIAAVVVAVSLAGAYLLIDKAWRSKQAMTTSTAVISDKSIAVLPFTDMSEKKDQEYFADGMAEEIIDELVKIPGLKVIGRTSSFQFKGHNEDLRKIGATLGVAYVLEGSVRKSGDHLRVTAQLIDVSDGAHRWSGTYDRDLVDVLKVQDEISLGLVRALQISMGTDELRGRPTLKSVEGYSLYLKGRLAFNRYDKQGFDEAASYFRQAMELDPASALVPAWLAYVFFLQPAYGFVPSDAGYDEEARRDALRSLSINPRSELAMGVLGMVQIQYDWDWAAGAAELDRALALAPGNARILAVHSVAPWALGQWNAAIRDLTAAVALDPLYPAAYNLLGLNHLGAEHWSEAEAALRKVVDIAPGYHGVHASLAKALLFKEDKQAALQQIELEPDEVLQSVGRAAINDALGRKADSDAALKRLTALISPNSAYLVASAHASRGESDAAFLWLDRALARKEPLLWTIKSEPYLNSLKSDPRYKAFLKKMNLPEA
jgi:TolB-like protein